MNVLFFNLKKELKMKRLNKVIKCKLLPAYFVIGESGQKLWRFPLDRIYAYDKSQEPKSLTANYRGRCDDTLFLTQSFM